MKLELVKIYQDLSSGKLTKEEALRKIKAIKQQEQGKTTGKLLAHPVWERASVDTLSGNQPEYTQHHVVLCEMPEVEEEQLKVMLPHGQVLRLQADAKESVAERYSSHALACFELIRDILSNKPQGKVLIQLVVANREEQTIFIGLSGLLKTAALENPQLVHQTIVTAPQTKTEKLISQLQENKGRPNAIIKYEKDICHILNWKEIATKPAQPKIAFKDQGVYILTGGLGGLGVVFTKEILKQATNSSIILTGRSALTSGKKTILESLPVGSNKLEYQQLDLDKPDQVKKLIASINKEHKQLNGIIHCAGMTLDNFILKKTKDEFQQVLAPKVNGTFNLDEASKDIDLDFLVLFSSITSTLGNVGQADYAAANGFMDQFAAYRNQLVLRNQRQGQTLSINWPLWQDGGMQIAQENQEALRKNFGVHPMPATTGVHAFYQSLELGYSQTLVMEGDVTQMRKALLEQQKVQGKATSIPAPEKQQVEAKISSASLAEKTEDYLCRQFAEVLKLAPHKIDSQAPLEKYGIDSILAMSLTDQLERAFDSLPKTLFFEYQTIHELAEYFIKFHSSRLSKLFVTEENNPEDIIEKQPAPQISNLSKRRLGRRRSVITSKNTNNSLTDDPIAIVGLSGRYPEAANIEAYWRNLREGKDCITEVPKDRWDWKEYYSEDRTINGHHFSKWGGFIEGVDEFDPRFFNISPREAVSIDPQERLFLQHAWMAVEDAGYTRVSLQIPHDEDMAGQVGVYVGVMYSEYQLFGAEASMRGKRMGISGSYASVANRVSYFLNLHGPSMTIDTMCSSSLTAIHIACQDLKEGRTNLAIAGGVNVSIHPNKYLMLSAGQFISNDGHCQSFGEGGDGYIPGEGVGVVVLKRLSEAKKDGNHIYGIIKGSSLNHGGKTNGYSVPNPNVQANAIKRALKESKTDPRHISYIEAHGTGTKLGDPIEIAALTKAFHQNDQDTGYCLIGSAKSNIGHCESAAGIAGLTKILLQMKHGQIVPSLHSTSLNPHIDFEKTPFVVNQTLKPWKQPVVEGKSLPRIAGISSFGAGGSNAHIILQEYALPAEADRVASLNGSKIDAIVPLSARTLEQLKQKAQDLLNFIRSSEQENKAIDLKAMAFTLQVGREAMDERLGFIVNSVDQLAEKLQAYLNGSEGVEALYQRQVKRNKDTFSMFSTDADMKQAVEKWIADKTLPKLLDLWVKGLELDWRKLYGEIKPKLISLPAYPFAREHYWIDISEEALTPTKSASLAVLHPLLHRNSSDLNQQSYSSNFNGTEFFVSDYQLITDGKPVKVLPAVAYLEMARAAVALALPAQAEPHILELQNTIWADPVTVTEDMQVTIALIAETNKSVDFEIYSLDNGEEIVHCQGQVIISPQPAPSVLDIPQLKRQMSGVQLASASVYSTFSRMGISYGASYQGIKSVYQGNKQLLADVSLPDILESSQEEYTLHPSIVESALQAGTAFMVDIHQPPVQPLLPYSIDSIRILNGCTQEMYAWVRYSAASDTKADIDLCDAQGNVCVQMHGVHFYEEGLDNVAQPSAKQAVPEPKVQPKSIQTAPKQIHLTWPVSNGISFNEPEVQKFTQVTLKKPTNVSLTAPEALKIEDRTTTQKVAVSLSNTSGSVTGRAPDTNVESYVSLFDNGSGIYSIKINATTDNTLSQKLIEQLLYALDFVKQMPSIKVLMLSGSNSVFLQGGREAYNEAVKQNLFQTIASFPCPVIAVMQGDATGAGFMVGALSDFMVCSQESKYAYTDKTGLFPTVSEELLFRERLGEVFTKEFLYQPTASTGRELKEKGWSCPILPADQVEVYAQKLALDLSAKSADSLGLLKQHLGRHMLALAGKLTAVEALKEESKSATAHKITSASKYLKVKADGDRILTISINKDKKKDKLKYILSGLTDILAQVEKGTYYKTMILTSDDPDFVSASDQVEEVLELQQLLFESPVPVIAAIESGAKDTGWLISQSCDACVYSEQGVYAAANLLQTPKLVRQAAMIFGQRLSHHVCKEILLTGKVYTGLELQKQTGAITIAEEGKVLSKAVQLAEQWTKLSWEDVNHWKKERAAIIKKELKQLPHWLEEKESVSGALPKTPAAIELRSQVIKATVHPEGIVEVRMEDREAKNMFSSAFIEGMVEVFEHIAQTVAYKVVVLTGYDSYFASGGTKESLLAIHEGKAKFTDTKIFQLALNCQIPVIAAMQGHGIGAGWSMGMFADFTLFSEESHYVSPYMNYGFTPGAGATMVFPDKTGYDLARETLLTAVEYSGSELKEKGLLLPVLSRKNLISEAFNLAKKIAKNSRSSLIALKHQLTRHLYDQLEETLSRELSMHEKTFVGQADTLKHIESNFYNAAGNGQMQTVPAEKAVSYEAQNTSHSRDVLPEIISSLKKMLAKELHMQEDEIDENSQFVDLGLDSIIGVTFIRKISDKYQIPLQATIVYSYSTIAKLSSYVKEEAEKQGVLVSKPAVPAIADAAAHVPAVTSPGIDVLPEIVSNLKKLLAKELHMQEDEIDENSQFVDLGLDSIIGVTFIRKISDKYQIPLQATIVYSYSTIAKLSSYVKEEAEKQGTLVSKPVVPVDASIQGVRKIISKQERKKLTSWRNRSSLRTAQSSRSGNQSQAIAVVGMAGQFPEAKNVEEFWQNIAGAKNCISEIPQKRWDVNKYFSEGDVVPGKTNSKWMGLLEEYDLFDPLFFTISPVEAESMDPQQRLFLQACWHTIENAGYNPHTLSGSKCGVYVGCAYGDYQMLSREQQLSAQGFTGGSTSILAARVSYFLNLQGPCISLDTACSSSLVAIANACDGLVSGSIDSALAGGVYVMGGPDMHIKTAQSGMLSTDGKCYTFDQRANGFVPGEGVGVVMLKRLEDAEKDNDNILGVIQGWGVNQDGKTNGITAPNTESQTLLEQQVYDQFNIDPNGIQLVEAHGTGTKLGDPIEVEGLRKSFKKYTNEKSYCALGSVKSNIGHCLTAAGVAGFIKVLQAMKHKQLPPTINFEQLNEHISLNDSPFYINTQLKDWEVKDAERRQAAISSFGFSGTNAHLVLGEYVPQKVTKKPVQVITQNSELIIPLSARTEEQLKQKAADLLEFIERERESIDLIEMAYTLQVGRDAMEERLGFMVSGVDQLVEKLTAYIKGEEDISGVYQGQVKRNKEGLRIISNDDEMREAIVANWISQKKLSKLLDLWVKGLDLDWNKLYGEHKPQRISLPVYPFAKERYWIDATDEMPTSANGITASVLHPLLHINTSDFSKQSYSATFSGEEFFLKDHRVYGQKVLPGVAYLEMIRAAIEKSMPSAMESTILELHNTAWIQPFIVNQKKQIDATLFLDDSDPAADEQIHYEIHSKDEGGEITHFQGQATFGERQAPEKLAIEQLKAQMQAGKLDKNSIYEAFTQMGLSYGPAHQGVTAIYKGDGQVLADLTLPAVVEAEQDKYLLHPSLMDSALQASIGLFQDLNQIPSQPLLPFALGSLSIISACTKNMAAWVRYSPDSEPDSRVTKLDIDLCDEEGNVCVQIRGFAFRVMENNPKPVHIATNGSISEKTEDTFDDAYYQKLIQSVLNKELSDEEAIELV